MARDGGSDMTARKKRPNHLHSPSAPPFLCDESEPVGSTVPQQVPTTTAAFSLHGLHALSFPCRQQEPGQQMHVLARLWGPGLRQAEDTGKARFHLALPGKRPLTANDFDITRRDRGMSPRIIFEVIPYS